MRTRVARWGDSLAVTIDDATADAAALKEGDTVDVAVKDDVIVRRARPRYTLAELLDATIPAEYRAAAVDWGPDLGREAVE